MPDFITGTTIEECMVWSVKKLLTLWFNSSYNSKEFSLFKVMNVIDNRLKKIQPPKFIHHMPRKVEEFVHWKAFELKTWLFYYTVPVLQGIMADVYFQHYLLLVAGISYLSNNVISITMIDAAKNFLRRFVQEFERIYG